MRQKPFELCAKCGDKAEAYFRKHGTFHSEPVIKGCKVCVREKKLNEIENALIRLVNVGGTA